MRMIPILAASFALWGFAPANAQQAPAKQPPPPATSPAAPAAQRVKVIDINQLPKNVQDEVNKVVAKQTSAETKKMRDAIDRVPEAKQALTMRGLSSAQVIATSLNSDGVLTLIIRKPG